MIKSGNLDTQERDLDLTNRDPKGTRKVLADLERVKHGTPTAEDELQALRARITAAATTVGKDPQPHCSDCFSRGWAAALKTLEE